MAEIWLRSNRRVLLLALLPVAALAVVGLLILSAADANIARWAGGIFLAMASVLTIGLVGQLRRPRIAYRDGEVLFYLRAGGPIAVPSEVVEAFFLGQGPAHLPLADGDKTETVNLVARLSEKSPEWSHVPVKEALGRWCDGYVTIRGTWCEPLQGEVIRRLNRRLRELREAASPEASPQSAERATEKCE